MIHIRAFAQHAGLISVVTFSLFILSCNKPEVDSSLGQVYLSEIKSCVF